MSDHAISKRKANALTALAVLGYFALVPLFASVMPESAAEGATGQYFQAAQAGAPSTPRVATPLPIGHYEAHSAARGWQFTLHGDTFEMHHPALIDRVGGVTYVGAIHRKQALSGGQDWLLEGSGGGAPISVTIDRAVEGCSDSGQAFPDRVTVAFNGMLWSGCGG